MRLSEPLIAPVRRLALYAAVTLAIYALVAAPKLQQLLDASGTTIAAMLLLCAALVALTAIDMETGLLPDAITLPLLAVGLMLAAKKSQPDLAMHAIAAAAALALMWGVSAAYRHRRGREGLGLGDAKLLAAAGAWLGPAALPSVLVWAAAAGLLAATLVGLRGATVGLTTRIPFGPYLAFAIWLVWLYGPIGTSTQ